jgi:hypothetical protein
MTETQAGLSEIAARLAAFLAASASGPATLSALRDEELLAETAAVAQAARLVAAAEVRLAGEIASRSRSELGDDGLSRSQNFATPAKLLASVAGLSSREARARLELGVRMRGAELLGGGTGPEPYPDVTGALMRGELGFEGAAVITRECAALAQRGVDSDAVRAAEQQLVGAAADRSLTVDDIARLAVRIREHLDPDGLEPRAEAQHEARSFSLSRSPDGVYRGRLALAPEAAAVWLGAIGAILSPRTVSRFGSEHVGQQLTADLRTTPQKMADAATELISRASSSPDMPRLAGATTAVNVHVSLADLEAGRGAGWVDGLDEPLPASAVARLRCSSPVVATVFGDRGEILHHGKARRLFSPAQNRALATRDGGCVWPSCDRPPPWCETHHVEAWTSPGYAPGRTDVDNGALLCHFHHSHLHKSAWRLVMRGGVPHIIPPRWIDTAQTPIRAGRRRTLPPPLTGHIPESSSPS